MTIAAYFILREQVGPHRWTATMIGIFGVLIVVRSGLVGFDAVSMIAIMGARIGADLMICTKLLTERESTLSIMAYVAVITTGLSIVPGLWSWQAPDRFELIWLLVIGVFGLIGQYFGISAFRAGDASFLAPIDYARLLISVVVGLWLFAERPDVWTGLGAAVSVMSTLYVNRTEMHRACAQSSVQPQPPGAPPLWPTHPVTRLSPGQSEEVHHVRRSCRTPDAALGSGQHLAPREGENAAGSVPIADLAALKSSVLASPVEAGTMEIWARLRVRSGVGEEGGCERRGCRPRPPR